MNRHDTETNCHCGMAYRGSDHCPECGCEQYESGDCGHTSTAVLGLGLASAIAAGDMQRARDLHVRLEALRCV